MKKDLINKDKQIEDITAKIENIRQEFERKEESLEKMHNYIRKKKEL